MVHFENVTQDFGDLHALNDVTFTIPAGGIVGLLGPNGAGKTTTMRIMTGFLEPTSGTVTIAGQPFTPDTTPLKRHIGYLPESAPSYGDMLAWDYLAYEARLHGIDPTQRIPQVIRDVGLSDHAHKPIRELSKGYRQRVGLAHTLIHDPDLLVLDEPTSGLDPNQIVEVRALIRRIARTKTVILSTHIMQEVEALCDRVIVIHDGTIRYDGSIASFSGTGQRIRIIFSYVEPKVLQEHLSRLPGVSTVRIETTPEDNLIACTVEADGSGDTDSTDGREDLRPQIFRLALEQGLTLYEMVRERTSMEDMFHQLTRETTHA